MFIKRFAIAAVVLFLFLFAGKVRAMEWTINDFLNIYGAHTTE